MLKKYYLKNEQIIRKKGHLHNWFIKLSGIGLVTVGISITFFYVLPVLIWQIIFKTVYASVASPVPSAFVLTPEVIEAMEREHTDKSLSIINSKRGTSIDNWLSNYKINKNKHAELKSYSISIPKLDISKAIVSTKDTDISKSLIQHTGTPIPPIQGNTVIFGHSTLPQLFENNNYETIFANAQNLKTGDEIIVHMKDRNYKYKIVRTFITEPDDLTVLNQNLSGSYLTLITCTPPGTVWKRLIIKASLTTGR